MKAPDSNRTGREGLPRRTLLGSLSGGAAGLLAGCSIPNSIASSSGGDDTNDEDDEAELTGTPTGTVEQTENTTEATTPATPTGSVWQTERTTDATARVITDSLDGGHLSLSVVQCNSASARAALGQVDGRVHISFNYEVSTEGYWEEPYVQVVADGEVAYDSDDDQSISIRKERASTTTGAVLTHADVAGDTAVRFGIRPSEYCSNGDHGETSFTVSKIQVVQQ